MKKVLYICKLGASSLRRAAVLVSNLRSVDISERGSDLHNPTWQDKSTHCIDDA